MDCDNIIKGNLYVRRPVAEDVVEVICVKCGVKKFEENGKGDEK